MQASKLLVTLLCASPLLTACGQQDDAHVPSVPGLMVSTEYVENFKAKLFASDIDGYDSHRIVIGKITVAPAHAVDPDSDLDDESKIGGIGSVKFSPDGRRLLLVALQGTDSSQIIVLDADGRNARTASPQVGNIYSGADWSPDMTKLAYVEASFGATNPRVTITDLLTDEVSEPGLNNECLAPHWDSASAGFYCSTYDESTDSSSLSHFFIATRQTEILQTDVAGVIADVSEDGDFALIIHKSAGGGRTLVRRRFSTGEERTIVQASGFVGGYFMYSPDRVIAYRAAENGNQLPTQYVQIGAANMLFTTMQAPAGTVASDFFPE